MSCEEKNGIKYCTVNGTFMVGTNVTGYWCNAASRDLSGNIEIPEKIGEKYIEAVGAAAFARCSKITHVLIKAKIKILYERAFADCCSLTYINIPSTVEEIRKGAIHSYNHTAYELSKSIIATGFLVVFFEPNSNIKLINSNNFNYKFSIAIHFSEPVYPKIDKSIFNNCAHPIVTCPKYFTFNGVRSNTRSCTKCRKATQSFSMISSLLFIVVNFS